MEGFDPAKLIINATHSHTSHVYKRDPGESRDTSAVLAGLIGEDKEYKALTGEKKPSMAEKGSHYSAYVTSGHVGHAGGEMIVRESVSTINRLFQK